MAATQDRLLTDSESAAVQDATGLEGSDVADMQGSLSQADARSRNIRLSLIRLAALALQQS